MSKFVTTIRAAKLAAFSALLAAFGSAHAAIDLTTLTNEFKASDVITAVMAVAATLAALYATMIAAKTALRWIRGG